MSEVNYIPHPGVGDAATGAATMPGRAAQPSASGPHARDADEPCCQRWSTTSRTTFTAMRFVTMAEAVGLGLGADKILLFVPSAQFAALLALTPGGLGIADWSWSGLLYKIGADRHLIVPYLVSLRLVVSLSIVVIAGVSWLVFRKVWGGRQGASG